MDNYSSLGQYLIRGGAITFLGKVLASILAIAITAMLARLLSPNEFGLYFLAFSLVSFLAVIAGGGLENTLIRVVSEVLGKNEQNDVLPIVYKGFVAILFHVVLVAILIQAGLGEWLAISMFDSEALREVSIFINCWMVVLVFQIFLSAVFRAYKAIGFATLFGGLLSSFLSAILLFIVMMYRESLSLQEALSIIIITGVISFVIGAYYCVGKGAEKTDRHDNTVSYKMLMSQSWPLWVNNMLMSAVAQSALWILAVFSSTKDIALYGSALKLVMLTSLTLAIVNTIVPQLIARMSVQGEDEVLERLLRATATITFAPTVLILIIFMCYSDTIMLHLYGEFYATGGAIVVLLSLGQMINVAVGSCGYVLVMKGYQKELMLAQVLTSILAVLLCVFLADQYGVIGVASGVAIGMGLQQLTLLFLAKYMCGMWTLMTFSVEELKLFWRMLK